MIEGINAAEKEIDGELYHILRLNNAQAAEMLDKLSALVRPVFTKMPPVTKDSEVIVAAFDRFIAALTNLGFVQLAKHGEEIFQFCFKGTVPLKGKFNDPEWAGKWDTILKLIGAFMQVQYGGFSKLLPSGTSAVLEQVKDKLKEQLAAASPSAPTSSGSTGVPSKQDGPAETK